MDDSRTSQIAEWSSGSLYRRFAMAIALVAGLAGCGGGGAGGSLDAEAPYATWTASPIDATLAIDGGASSPPEEFDDKTIRHEMRMSLAGDRWRVRLSNRFGHETVSFSGVSMARSTGNGTIEAGSSQTVTFGGSASVTLAAGQEADSDPVDLAVPTFGMVSVSVYFAGLTPMPTLHPIGQQYAYVGAGKQLVAPSISPIPAGQRLAYFGITAIHKLSRESQKVVVAFGDSLTDGSNSTIGASKRYPNQLDDRLKAAGLTNVSVVNAGIEGNRWLHDGVGPAGASRFAGDALGVAGVSHVIVLLGINDLGFQLTIPGSETVSAEQIVQAIAGAIAQAKERKVKILLGTLPPFKNSSYYTADNESKRQTINAWIRNNRDADAIVDFDRALQDPNDPLQLNPAYDFGDHLHPNDTGYAAMAAAVAVSWLE